MKLLSSHVTNCMCAPSHHHLYVNVTLTCADTTWMAIDVNVAMVTVKRVSVHPVLSASVAARTLSYTRIHVWHFVLLVTLPITKCDLASRAAVTVKLVTKLTIVRRVKHRMC